MSDNDSSWGVANGEEHSITAKRAARKGQDVPETLERQFQAARRALTPQDWDAMKDSWRNGLIDLALIGGHAHADMTHAQAALWQQATSGG